MTKQLTALPDGPELVAAVDLGSNSFHLLVGRVDQTPHGANIVPIDSLKEAVRLASGLSPDKRLDATSQARAVAALSRFGERLRAFHPQKVRVVATNTFRVAKNGADLLRTCEAALGFPIEVIAGKEEARLIYNGVAHTLAADGTKRLVVDIGGGSTEFIIGTDYTPELLESVFIGCIRFSRDYFPGGDITRSGFKQAILEARREIQVISANFKATGWDQAVGASGSAKALVEVLDLMGLAPHHSITPDGLETLKNSLIKRGVVDPMELPGLKPDRIPVFTGGLAIMTAIFEELGIDEMQYSDGALRLGVLYDVLGRQRQDDMRFTTVEQFMARYAVDRTQAKQVGDLAIALWEEAALGSAEERAETAQLLRWVACLLEIGFSISHNSHHKHSAYIVSQADMPGFSRREQRLMSNLVLGHVGKLGKLAALMTSDDHWAALACVRLASIFYRSRAQTRLPNLHFQAKAKKFKLSFDGKWLERHPLTAYTLEQECSEWSKVGFDLQIVQSSR
jgi:exopolyphosphatase/guanosine-5'-triphosphate,3'-diphosphate pyrophosphatase